MAANNFSNRHMSGKELADRVRASYPHIRILFTSAYTENAIIHQGVLNEGLALLQKPFAPSPWRANCANCWINRVPRCHNLTPALFLSSIRRPAFSSSASLFGGPISCRLVTGTGSCFSGIGIASAGFPAKLTATVFCRFNTLASKRAILPTDGIGWRRRLKSR